MSHALEAVRDARDATLAAGSARLTLTRTAAWSAEHGLGWKPARELWRRTLGRPVRVGGTIDLRARRFTLDQGAREGAVGQATPLWLVDLLYGAVSASELPPLPGADGGFTLDRRFRVTVDMAIAAEREPDFYVPRRAGDGFPVDVVVHHHGLLHELAATIEDLRVVLTLHDHGVDLTRYVSVAGRSTSPAAAAPPATRRAGRRASAG